MDEKELEEKLIKENEEFRKVYELHQQCEKELERLGKKTYLSDEQKLEEKQLKKRKLALKDRMYHLMSKYGESLR